MYYVYLIENSDGDRYIGYTSNLKRRLQEHREEKSFYTSKRRCDWQIIYYEAYVNKEIAIRRERALKRNRSKLYKRLGLQ